LGGFARSSFLFPFYVLISGCSSRCPTLCFVCMSPVTVLPLANRSTLPSCDTIFSINLFHRQSLVLTSNIKKGFLDATCNGKLLPKIEALHVFDLAATLISSPQLVSKGNMDMVHSKHYGSFMQPACDSCPICTPNVNRIMIATTATDMSISNTPCDTQ